MVVGPIRRTPPAAAPVRNGTREAQLRPIKTITAPSTAGPTTTEIPRDFVLQDLILSVSAVVTVTSAGTAAVTSEQPFNLIRSIEISGSPKIAGQRATLKRADAAALFRLQHILKGTEGLNTPIASTPVTVTISYELDLDFELEGMGANRRDTLLRGRDWNSLDLTINWGDLTDIITVGTGSIALSAAQAVLSVHEFRDPLSLAQNYESQRIVYDEQAVPSATAAQEFLLRGRNILRGILIKQFTRASSANAHTPVNSIINAVSLELDSDRRQYWNPYSTLRGDNKTAFSLETLPTGYAFLDLMKGKNRDTQINVNSYSSPLLLFDVNAVTNGYIRIYPIEIM
jgi:hypothetical protein